MARRILVAAWIAAAAVPVFSSAEPGPPSRLWEPAVESAGSRAPAETQDTWRVRWPELRKALAGAGPETAAEITLPLPDGRIVRFRARETPLLGDELRRKVPDFHAYLAAGVDVSMQARVDVSVLGVRALIFTPRGTAVIDPVTLGRTEVVKSFWMSDAEAEPLECEAIERGATVSPGVRSTGSAGDQLRTLRYVMMATGEYTVQIGGGAAATAAMLTQINRLNAALERDAAVTLQAVQVVAFPNPSTDPYPSGSYTAAFSINTAVVDSMFGSESYDVSQVLSYMAGPNPRGISYSPCVCDSGYKGGCAVGSTSPGSIAESLTLGHEIGHAVGGAGHTQDRACNRSANTAYEVSSGITIVCSMPAACPVDFQSQRDPYYHGISIEQLVSHVAGRPGCGSITPSGNNPPTAGAGPDITIPRDTPFVLAGSGSDPDPGDTLTYTWEQFDKSPTAGDSLLGPLFRWRPPTTSPVRLMPALATVLAATTDPWERLARANRSLRFRLVVRDNRPGTGGVAWDEKVITVSGAPFAVTFPNGGNTFASGEFFVATWDVGGGSVAADVRISLSTDGGASWQVLRSVTANDGSESIAFLTATGSTQCRLRVEAVGNIFYDVSNADFTITPGVADAIPEPAPAGFALEPARPNPATGTVTLRFDLPNAAGVDLAIFDVAGQRIRTLAAGRWPAGRHSASWDGRDDGGRVAGPGVYFAKLEAGGNRASRRVLRLR